MELIDGKVYSIRELQELLGISRMLALRLVQSGRLHGVKVGKSWRVLGSDIRDYFERDKTGRTEVPR
ncbi:MAG: helix-turn-helix domain-containing protein [Dehalococcoidia bacterium]|nr:helix-turn-helix domain-containing protein [Dehalococcoidia bacterium]